MHKHNSYKTNYQVVNAIRKLQSNTNPRPTQKPPEGYTPKNAFADFAVSDTLKKNIAFRKYSTPTPIQDQAIPTILSGRDLIAIANTGTGKTAAFLIPLIEKVSRTKNEKVLILAPTRELANQISDELYGFTYGLNISWALCTGGNNMGKQIDSLAKHPNFVIGTPGRLKDLSQKRFLNLSDYKTVVLDEADRMVDIGFINNIKYFINLLPTSRQSLFFSATIPPKVQDILKSFVKNPITISVKTQDTVENISQEIITINGKHTKFELLINLLDKKEFNKVMVFGRTKWGVQKLSNELTRIGFSAAAIHGNKNQGQRQRVLDDFKNNKIAILLATDIASRGIDIPNVSHVINYDVPQTYDDYIHRIGRTGRADKKGTAITFV